VLAEHREINVARHRPLPSHDMGMTQPAIAEAMGVSLNTVNRAHMAYDGGGIKALNTPSIAD
jgi:transposase